MKEIFYEVIEEYFEENVMNRKILNFLALLLMWLIPGVSHAKPEQPTHLFSLYSYGRSIAPARTHTFAYFAKMLDGEDLRIEEHVPFSWLPIVTRPRHDPDGQPQFDAADTLQVEALAIGRVQQMRLGWNFGMKKTIAYRRRMGGITTIKSHGAFAISPEQYAAAKNFREDMLQNVRLVSDGQTRIEDRYYYKPINQTLFTCPQGRISGQLNCFQAVLAAFGICETSGPLSGVTVTDYILSRLRARGVIDAPFLSDDRDLQNLLDQVFNAEESGAFDRP